MIRYAVEKDFEQIKILRKISFPNDDKFFEWFYKNDFITEEIIVYEKDGVICSLLGRIPFEMKGAGRVTYIYGVCTHPDFRNQNLMSKLMEFSENEDIKKGIKASLLVPQNEGLFEFYKKFGYKPHVKLFKHTSVENTADDDTYKIRKSTENDIDIISFVYEKCVEGTNYVIRSKNYWRALYSMFDALGGKVFTVTKNDEVRGYAFVWNDKETIAQEILCLDDRSKQVFIQKLKGYCKTEKIITLSPLDINISEGERVNYGCIKSYQNLQNELPFYMNLMLD